MSEKICRLCLQTINNNHYQAIEESMLKTLKLNLKISEESVMCIECASCLRVFSKLTPCCVYVGTLPLSDLENDVKLDTRKIKAISDFKALMETEINCSFCAEAHRREDLISLNQSKENKFMVNMLEQYISETNLKSTEELLTCETCLGAFQGVPRFILKCLEVEEKISEYIELKGTDDKGQIELKQVQQFILTPILKLENEPFTVNDIEGRCDQIKEEYTPAAEAEIKFEKEINTELILKTENAYFKSEQIDCDIKTEQSNSDGVQEPFIENEISNDPLHISMVIPETRESKFHIKQHPSTHKISSEIKMLYCEICSYKTKHKGYWKRHLLSHKSVSELKMFKCELCSYEAKLKSNLIRHLLTHKSLSEIKMFECELCSYEARQKSHLNQHLLTHKSLSEIKMFKCESCSYMAKRKSHLTQHLLTHKCPSEIKTFKCELCSYKSKRKHDLKMHLLTHRNASEINTFKCESCPYEAIYKSHLTRHLLTHKRPSKKMFKCELCSYRAKYQSSFKKHLSTHGGAS